MRRLFIFVFLCCATVCAHAQSRNIAYSDNHVRFTVISDGAVRMEYSPDGKFVDNKSFVAVCRQYDAVNYRVKTGSWLEITTSKMKLRYKKDSGPFTNENLSVASTKNVKPSFVWRPGMKQKENLKGTYRTLDGYLGDRVGNDTTKRMPIEDGLLAKDGWTLIDDSNSLLFDGDTDFEWVTKRGSNAEQDWYFMAYGHDYKTALKDYTRFAGRIPLPPRYAFGYWWSRYWMYSDKEMRHLVKQFQNHNVPMDVLVVDMDWHYTTEGLGGWTGWTWNKGLFPDYTKFLSFLKENNLKVTLNLHPADGVKHFEAPYAAMAQSMGIDSASRKDIPYVGSSKLFMNSLFNTVLDPMTKNGVSFWWLDWQQRLNDTAIPELSNTWWINYVFFTHMEKANEHRPLIYHRWGGLGNHRYQIGFSGDSWISWKSLDFQPYFNSTAANVLYGYWSHDLGGHNVGKIVPEMYIRWMQFGALSPIMRTHSTKQADLRKEPWAFDASTCENLCNIIRQRYTMAPYIYAMARKAYDDALSLCRPLYYEEPDAAEAYGFRNEYMFGDDILVAPITSPMNGSYSVQKIWLPCGKWYEMTTGTMEEGGAVISRDFAIDEYPIYVKAGSILPFYDAGVKNLQGNDEDVVVTVFPGEKGHFSFYEDNGDDKNYRTEYATTNMSNERNGNEQTVIIGARQGHYKDMPSHRHFRVKVLNTLVPVSVTVNGVSVECRYDGEEFAALIDVPQNDCNVEKVIKITYASTTLNMNGAKAKARRLGKAIEALKYQDAGIAFIAPFARLGSVNEAMMYDTGRQPQIMADFLSTYDNLPETLRLQGLDGKRAEWFLKEIDYQSNHE